MRPQLASGDNERSHTSSTSHPPRMQKPPPLQLLPAFEAAARLLSFSKAAAELHLTTAAISQQIKQLEGHLDMPLFRRLTRRVELTDAGSAFAEVVSQTLSTYRVGHADLLHRYTRPVLRLSASLFVAHELLIPRLGEFQSTYPHVDVRLEASMDLVDFEHDPVDAAIRLGSGNWPGLVALPLCTCQATLVASPELLRDKPIHNLADLKQHTLIHPRQNHADWDVVARFANLPRLERQGDLILDSDLAALKAAEAGLGVTLIVTPTGAPLLHSRHLSALMPPVTLPMQAYFVFRPNDGKEALLMDAYNWIRQTINNFADSATT